MKTYQFRFESRPCEFHPNGTVSVSYMLFYNEDRGQIKTTQELTWPDAKEFFERFVDQTTGPRACYMSCHSQRMPPGYKAYKTTIYKEGPANV